MKTSNLRLNALGQAYWLVHAEEIRELNSYNKDIIVAANAALSMLSHRDKHIVLMRFFDNKSIAKMAYALNLSDACTRGLLIRALHKLAEKLYKFKDLVKSNDYKYTFQSRYYITSDITEPIENDKRQGKDNIKEHAMLFRNEYYFLSNFYPASITRHGVTWPTAEHMYQACKSPDASVREQIRLHPSKGLKAFVRTIAIRPEWNKIRVECMRCILKYKFEQHPDLMARLKAITIPLVETNYWNDTFWGECDGIGQNTLGKLLMEIRDQHQSHEP